MTHSRARCLRVAMGLSSAELADRLEMRTVDVLRAEDGDLEPRCGWGRWEQVLDDELVRWVQADGRHWSQIWPTPIEASRLRQAFYDGTSPEPTPASAPEPTPASAPEPVSPAPVAGPSLADFGATLDW